MWNVKDTFDFCRFFSIGFVLFLQYHCHCVKVHIFNDCFFFFSFFCEPPRVVGIVLSLCVSVYVYAHAVFRNYILRMQDCQIIVLFFEILSILEILTLCKCKFQTFFSPSLLFVPFVWSLSMAPPPKFNICFSDAYVILMFSLRNRCFIFFPSSYWCLSTTLILNTFFHSLIWEAWLSHLEVVFI